MIPMQLSQMPGGSGNQQTPFAYIDESRVSYVTTPKIISYLALFFLVCGHFVSALVFVLDSTNRDTISLWYTAILWPLWTGLLLTVFIASAYIYIGRLPRDNSMERAAFFYPRYQWEVLGGITNSVWIYIFGLALVIWIVPGLGLGFEPDYTLVGDSDTENYTTLHLLMACISLFELYQVFGYTITYIGRIYVVKPVEEIVEAVPCANRMNLVQPARDVKYASD